MLASKEAGVLSKSNEDIVIQTSIQEACRNGYHHIFREEISTAYQKTLKANGYQLIPTYQGFTISWK